MNNRYLVAYTTYGSPAYIDLGLSFLKLFNIDTVVFDDNSNDVLLESICKKHDVPLIKDKEHYEVYGRGDVCLTYMSMEYALTHGYTHVIKVSRRWIFLKSPIESLEWLEDISDASTYTSYDTSGLGFRTECICYRMKEWKNAIPILKEKVEKDECGCLVEGLIHHYAKEFQSYSEKYKKYIRCQQPYDENGYYAHWDWIGTAKNKTPKYILWHDTNSPIDYYNKAIEIGLNTWTLEDFEKVILNK